VSGHPATPAVEAQPALESPEPSERDREFLDFLIRLACEAVAERHRQARAANDNQTDKKRTT
jgi:hypothetical protein